MANEKVRLDFTAMFRSLRATGCDLPVYVIPFDETRFDLPKGATWLENPRFYSYLGDRGMVNHCRKLLALTFDNFVFFDTDIIHIDDVSKRLTDLPANAFVVADPEWSLKKWTFSEGTKKLYEQRTSTWVLDNFNTGFFAKERFVFSQDDLMQCLQDPLATSLCQGSGPTRSEQETINLILFWQKLEVTNLCLPPYRMESTFCWDYSEANKELVHTHPKRSFFIHFPSKGARNHCLAPLFHQYLSSEELAEWQAANRPEKHNPWPLSIRILNKLVSVIDANFYIQPRLP